MMTYKGYTAKVEVDTEAGLLHGRVIDINDTITFEGKTVDEIRQEFYTSVDRYLEFCSELGQQPDKPFSGKLPFRTTPDIHRTIYLAATQMDRSINAWMEEVLAEAARSTLMIKQSHQETPTTPLEDYEYEQYLAQIETKLNQLRESVKPYLKENDPHVIDQLLMVVADFLHDQDLRQYVLEATKEEDIPALTTTKPADVKPKRLSGTVASKRKHYRHG